MLTLGGLVFYNFVLQINDFITTFTWYKIWVVIAIAIKSTFFNTAKNVECNGSYSQNNHWLS